MAEVGAIASIVGLIVTGAQLSNVLFDVGSSLGSAGWEVRAVGTEIALFCSVMRLLERMLDRAEDRRYSIGAIETAQEILSQCQAIFNELKSILDGLQRNGSSSNETSVDFLTRIKWVIRRPQVQMQRATLESCKITLHIMLTTLEFARRLSIRKDPSIDIHAEIEQEEQMTQSLFMAQSCAIERVEMLEDELEQTGDDGMSPGRLPKEASQFYSSGVTHATQRQRRTSMWLHDLLPQEIPNLSPEQSQEELQFPQRKGKRLSYLLEKWTDQRPDVSHFHETSAEQHHRPGDCRVLFEKDKVTRTFNEPPELLRATRYLNQENVNYEQRKNSSAAYKRSRRPRPLERSKELPTPPDTPYISDPPQNSSQNSAPQGGSISPNASTTTPRTPLSPRFLTPPSSSFATPSVTPRTKNTPKMEPNSSLTSLEGFKNMRIGKEDTCEKMLPAAVRKHKITDNWHEYALFVFVDDQERRLGLQEKPLGIYSRLTREGKKVSFVLRKLEILGASYENRPDYI
ncbi:MAG: Adaptor for signal transduction [Icmadophila ericetorum]|nr:Adaptor for signal transduction [Icmadophila ericetorum]